MSNEETLYARFITGELTKKEIADLKKSGDWEKLEAIADMTSTFKVPDLDKKTGFSEILNRKNKSQVVVKPIKRNLQIWISIAACFALFASTLFWFNNRMTTLEAAFSNSLKYDFMENSNVVLNAGSSLSFTEKNWENNRTVELTGEAFFTVSKGETFIVKTDQGLVQVLGTQFNVRSWPGIFEVECYEGKVEVIQQSENTILTAQNGVYTNEGIVQPIKVNKSSPDWMNGRSVFNEKDLQYVFAELERQYNIEVNSNENGTFNGSFVHANLGIALDQIAKPMGLKVAIKEDSTKVTFTK